MVLVRVLRIFLNIQGAAKKKVLVSVCRNFFIYGMLLINSYSVRAQNNFLYTVLRIFLKIQCTAQKRF